MPSLDLLIIGVVAWHRSIGKRELCSIFWPDTAPNKAQNSLRQRLFRIRRACGADIIEESNGLRLAGGVQSDIERYRGGAGTVAEVLLDDYSLLAGAEFSKVDTVELWLQASRLEWRDLMYSRLVAWAEQAVGQRMHGTAVDVLRRAIALDRLNERAYELLLHVQLLDGDESSARSTYAACEQALRAELGIAPSASLSAMLVGSRRLPTEASRITHIPASLRLPPQLIGRDGLLDRMELCWKGGRDCLILGEAGIGKTRLLNEFRNRVGDAHYVKAVHGDASAPYSLVLRLCEAVARGAIALVADTVRRSTDAVADTEPLRAGAIAAAIARDLSTGPSIKIIIDDMHFADEASAEALRNLILGRLSASTHWCVASRTESPHTAWLDQPNSPQPPELDTFRVPPLGRSDVVSLVRSLGLERFDADVTGETVWRRIGGNPLYILETLRESHRLNCRDIGEHVHSPSVKSLMERRLHSLRGTPLSLARLAALAERDFSVALAERFLGMSALELTDAWRALTDAGILAQGSFIHDLMREAVSESVPHDIALHIHSQIADYLGMNSGEPARIAEHLFCAGQWKEAADAFLTAAEQAHRLGSTKFQVHVLKQAIACLEHTNESKRLFATRLKHVAAITRIDGTEAGLALLSTISTDTLDDEDKVQLLHAKIEIEGFRGNVPAMETMCREACRLSEGLGSISLLTLSKVALSWAHRLAGRATDALEALWSIDCPPQEMDLEVRLDYYSALSAAYLIAQQRKDALVAAHLALEAAIEAKVNTGIGSMLVNLTNQHLAMGDVQQALSFVSRGAALHRQREEAGMIARVNRTYEGVCLTALGQYGRAQEVLADTYEQVSAGRDGIWVHMVEHALALVYIRLGRSDLALRLLDDLPPEFSPVHQARRWAIQARACKLRGEPYRSLLEKAFDAVDPWTDTGLQLALIDDTLGLPVDTAIALCERAIGLGIEQGLRPLELLARTRLVEIAVSQHDLVAARRHLNDAHELVGAYAHAELYPPELLMALAAGFRMIERPSVEQELVRRARAWLTKAGASLPQAFSSSFLHAHPVHQVLRAR